MSGNEAGRMPQVGEVVVYHNPVAQPRNALINAVHGETCVNLVMLEADEDRQDTYGRQIERLTSMSHISVMGGVHGNYWRYPEEKPNPVKKPLAS